MEIRNQIISLAEQYEKPDFIMGDPSWFMHQVDGRANQELTAFIASTLSFGARSQFMPKVQGILDAADGDVFGWLKSGEYEKYVPQNDKSFYRIVNCNAMFRLCKALQHIVKEYGTLKNFVAGSADLRMLSCIEVLDFITSYFRPYELSGLIPKDIKSPCKRLCMFLRWMVRDNSPVDLGIWSDIIDKRSLIIPLDTHVFQQANRLELVCSRTASMATAIKISERMLDIFPDDPMRGDFALFGYGVNNK